MSDSMLGLGNRGADKSKGWSKSGSLTTMKTDKTVQTQATEFGQAMQFTVQFSVTQIANPSATNVRQRAKALVTWSVAGNSVSRQITLYDGASISGVGEAVKVVVSDDSVRIGPATAFDNQPYDVAFQFAPGTRPSQQQPPFYYESGTHPALVATVNVPIPQNIGVISTFIQVSGLLLTLPDIMYASVGNGRWLLGIDKPSLWRPIPPGSTSIQLTRTNLIGSVPWEVFFGIDG
jgi:hypothetical protein